MLTLAFSAVILGVGMMLVYVWAAVLYTSATASRSSSVVLGWPVVRLHFSGSVCCYSLFDYCKT